MVSIIKDSEKYSIQRKFIYSKYNKKVNLNILKEEVMVARILGEMSGAERLLQAIVQNKDWTREDIEAEIHVFIKDVNNIVVDYFKDSKIVDLEDVLKAHGYIKD